MSDDLLSVDELDLLTAGGWSLRECLPVGSPREAAMRNIERKGWVEEDPFNDRMVLTEAGKARRDAAEFEIFGA